MHQELGNRSWLTEVDTEQAGRVHWMRDLANYVGHTPWLKGRGAIPAAFPRVENMLTGNMNWQIYTDPSKRARQTFRDLALAASWPATPVHQHGVNAGA